MPVIEEGQPAKHWLIRLTANQIAERWELFERGIDATFPDVVSGLREGLGSRVLQQILSGYGQAWVLQREEEELALVVTTVMFDGLLGEKFLFLYSLYALAPISLDAYKEGFEQLREFARAQKCSAVLAYTVVDRIERVSKFLGGKTTTFIRLEV